MSHSTSWELPGALPGKARYHGFSCSDCSVPLKIIIALIHQPKGLLWGNLQTRGFTISDPNTRIKLQLTPSGATIPVCSFELVWGGWWSHLSFYFGLRVRNVEEICSHLHFFTSVGQVSTATLCERFRTKCLTNHLNLQLPLLRLDAIIAEVKKCSP